MSETRYQEGEDLEELLAELDEQHQGRFNVLSVSYPRTGGLMGFFARERVGVEYEVTDASAADDGWSLLPGGAQAATDDDPLAELIRAAEQDESRPCAADDPLASIEGTNAEFARMLLEMAREKAGERQQAPADDRPLMFEPVSVPVLEDASARVLAVEPNDTVAVDAAASSTTTADAAPTESVPTDTMPAQREPRHALPDSTAAAGADFAHEALPHPLPQSTHTPVAPVAPVGSDAGTVSRPTPGARPAPRPRPRSATPDAPDARALLELGIPAAMLPNTSIDPYAAVTRVIACLPSPEPLPTARGSLVAIAGPGSQVRRWAQQISTELGLSGNCVIEPARLIDCAKLRLGSRSVVVVIDTDEVGDGGTAGYTGTPTSRELLAELRPDALWAWVDASHKTADIQADLDDLGIRPDALIVDRLARTGSPATVWELPIPVAIMDGEPATPARWRSLLLDKLAAKGV